MTRERIHIFLIATAILFVPTLPRSSKNVNGSNGSLASTVVQVQEVTATPKGNEILIWEGRSSGLTIRWTTHDLYLMREATREAIWQPLVSRGFEDFRQLYLSSSTTPTARSIDQCTYERTFTVIAV